MAQKVRVIYSVDTEGIEKANEQLRDNREELGLTEKDVEALSKKYQKEGKKQVKLLEELKQKEKELRKEREKTNDPKMLKKINAELEKTVKQIEKIEQVQKKRGKEEKRQLGILEKLIKEEKELSKARLKSNDPEEIKKYNKQLSETSAKIKNLKGETEVVQQKSSGFGQTLKSVGGALVGAFAVERVVSFAKDSVQAFATFEAGLKSLQAITGVTDEDLKGFQAAAERIGATTTISANEAVKAFELIGSAKPDLLESQEALIGVTESAITLAEASGLDLPTAATALTDALNQFGAPAEEAGRFINVLAAGSKFGAAAVPAVTEALVKFGAVAKSSNVSVEESVGLIEALAERGIQGAEAGTKLRNVLLKLATAEALPKEAVDQLKAAGVNTDVLADSSLSLGDRLNELAKIQGNAVAISKVFGAENAIAGQIVIENRDRIQELTGAVTGTQTAFEQAETQTSGLGAQFQKFSNLVEIATIKLGEALSPFVEEVLAGLKDGVNALISPFKGMFEGLQSIFEPLGRLGELFGISAEKGGIFSTIMEALALAFKIFIGPTKLVFQAIGFVIDAFVSAIESVKAFIEESPRLMAVLNTIASGFSFVGDAISSVSGFFKDILGISEEVDSTFKKLGAGIKAYADSIGATNAELQAFAAQFDRTKLAGKSLQEQTEILKKEFDAFRAGQKGLNEEAGQTTDSLDDIAVGAKKTSKEVKGAAGSITALTKEIGELNKQIAATADLEKQISLIEKRNALEKELGKAKIQLLNVEKGTKDQIEKVNTKNLNLEFDANKQLQNRTEIVGDQLGILENLNNLLSEAQQKRLTATTPEELASANKEIERLNEQIAETQSIGKDEPDENVLNRLFGGDFDPEDFAEIAAFALNTAQEVFSSINELQSALAEQRLAELDKEEQDALEKVGENAALREQVEEEFATKRDELQKEQAEKAKRAAIFEALINSATAITRVFATTGPPASFILAGITAGLTAVQLATIRATPTPFAKGGMVEGGTPGKDSVHAVLMPGERVMTVDKVNKYGPWLEAIHDGTFDAMLLEMADYLTPQINFGASRTNSRGVEKAIKNQTKRLEGKLNRNNELLAQMIPQGRKYSVRRGF